MSVGTKAVSIGDIGEGFPGAVVTTTMTNSTYKRMSIGSKYFIKLLFRSSRYSR
jgi:hypothetical protein